MVNTDKTIKKRTKRKLIKKQMEGVELLLLFHTPGYRWFGSNQHRLNKETMNKMDVRELMWIVSKSFRYYHLNLIVRGDWASEAAKQQRRERWIMDIEREARFISKETNVKYEKVLTLLLSRISKEIQK